MDEDWGPWQDHDQMGCPVADGVIVHIESVFRGVHLYSVVMIGVDYTRDKWDRADLAARNLRSRGVWPVGILRYRIRKPKGMSILTDILREVVDTAPMRYKERELEPAL